jgi:two-component system sensor histidine kinase DegS
MELLRQKQSYLAEHLVGLAASARRLQTIIRQFELSADYLLGSNEEAEDPGNGAGTSQLQALELQEEERQRLAREIHDGPAQTLANAIFQMEFCLRLLEKDPSRLPGELARLKEDLREGLADTRYFIFDLRPGPLADLGLPMTIQRYLNNYQSRFNIAVSTDLEDDLPRLTAAKELAVFRVIQEALQNTRKHSGASQATVALRREGDTLVTSVTDNGRGFEMGTVGDGGNRHFGLLSMRERAQLVQGDLQITSQPGKGTRMTLRMPLGSP